MAELILQIVLILFLAVIVFIVERKYYLDLKKKSFVDSNKSEIHKYKSIQPQTMFVDLSPKSSDLIDLAVEIWRIKNRIAKVESGLPEIQKRGLESSIQKLSKYIDSFNVKIVDHAGQKYNEGMSVNVLSFELDPSISTSVIKETIEPTIIYDGKVIRKGKVIVVKNT
jgi:hypothetical protein